MVGKCLVRLFRVRSGKALQVGGEAGLCTTAVGLAWTSQASLEGRRQRAFWKVE